MFGEKIGSFKAPFKKNFILGTTFTKIFTLKQDPSLKLFVLKNRPVTKCFCLEMELSKFNHLKVKYEVSLLHA